MERSQQKASLKKHFVFPPQSHPTTHTTIGTTPPRRQRQRGGGRAPAATPSAPPDSLPFEKMEGVPETSSPLLDRIMVGHGTLPLFLSTVAGAVVALFLVYLVRALHRFLRRRAGGGGDDTTEGELAVQYTELPRRRRGRRSRGAAIGHEGEEEEEEEDDDDMEEDIFDDLYGYDEELDFDLEDRFDSYNGGRGGRATATPTPTHASATPPPPTASAASAAAAAVPTVMTLRGEDVGESSSSKVPDDASVLRPPASGVVASTQEERSEEIEGRRKEGGRTKGRLRDEIIEEKWGEEEDLEAAAGKGRAALARKGQEGKRKI